MTKEEIIADAIRYRALLKWGVQNWVHYYDALSDLFEDPREDYEDMSEIVAKYIESGDIEW